MIEGSSWADSLFGKPRRLRCGVRIKCRPCDVSSTRPESRAADLMRISFARHQVRAGTLRSGSPGKARHRQIEAPPEEMHRAYLADKARAKLFEHGIDPYQNAPEAMRCLRVVRRVNLVFLEGNWIEDLTRRGPDTHIHAKLAERRHEAAIKLSYALRFQRERALATVARFDDQLVFDEIELNFHGALAVRHCRSRQAPGVHVERHIPPVVHQGTQFQANLADHLRPHVQGCESVLPAIKGQRREKLRIARACGLRFWRHHAFSR